MGKLKDDLTAVLSELKTQRDLLVLKIHLAEADVKDEWQDLERKWDHINARNNQLKQEVKETAVDVGEDLKYLSQDLKEGYARIKKLLHR